MKQILILITVVFGLSFTGCQLMGDKKDNKTEKNDSIKVITKTFSKNPGSSVEYKIPMKLNAEGEFVKHGTTIRYLKSGKVASKTPYVIGKKEGIRLTYHTTGKVYKEQPYENGLLTGICKRYDRQGLLAAEYPYKNGLPGIGLVEYTNLGKKRPTPTLYIVRKDEIKSNGRYKLTFSLTGKGTERIKSVQFYQGKLVEGKYFHKNLQPARDISTKKGEMIFELSKGAVLNKTINIVAVATMTSGLKLILQKPVKISVRGL